MTTITACRYGVLRLESTCSLNISFMIDLIMR